MKEYIVINARFTIDEWKQQLSNFLEGRYKPKDGLIFEEAFNRVVPDKSPHPCFDNISIGELYMALDLIGLTIARKAPFYDPNEHK